MIIRLVRTGRQCPRLWTPSRRGFLAVPTRTAATSTAASAPTERVPTPGQAITLRAYQKECIQSVLTAFAQGRRQIGISLATGAGKTVIFTELIGRVAPRAEATQTLILVHRQELVEQAAAHCSRRYPDKVVDIEMGNLHASGNADITVASVQSINSGLRINKFDRSNYKLILVDEAHHIVARSYLGVLSHFGLDAKEPDPETTPALVGVSATFGRHDGLALGKAIKHIVYHKDYIDMIGEKWLSDVIFTTVESKANLAKVKTSKATGDFLSRSLSAAVDNDETNLITVRAWSHKAADRKSTLVFCVDLQHLSALTNMFRAHGVDARFVTGDTPRQVRSQRLDAFRNGEFPVLLNCGVFTEGTDIPNIDCVILARPTKSRNLLVQMIGRGMRLHPGKRDCHIIDMVASLEGGIVTTPSLFGLDPDLAVEASNPTEMQKIAEEKRHEEQQREEIAMGSRMLDSNVAAQALRGAVTFTDYDSVNDLVSDTSGERHIRALSQNAWVNVGTNRFVLTGDTRGSYIVLELKDDDSLWRVMHHAKVPGDVDLSSRGWTAYARPREVARTDTFESALRAADTFAGLRFPQNLITLRRPAAAWRDKPASKGQLDFLNKQRVGQEKLVEYDMTKGEAGDAITKFKHGAKTWFKQISSAKRQRDREVRKAEAEKIRKENEIVRVGPVGGGSVGVGLKEAMNAKG